jgi:hypothetical protein
VTLSCLGGWARGRFCRLGRTGLGAAASDQH